MGRVYLSRGSSGGSSKKNWSDWISQTTNFTANQSPYITLSRPSVSGALYEVQISGTLYCHVQSSSWTCQLIVSYSTDEGSRINIYQSIGQQAIHSISGSWKGLTSNVLTVNIRRETGYSPFTINTACSLTLKARVLLYD